VGRGEVSASGVGEPGRATDMGAAEVGGEATEEGTKLLCRASMTVGVCRLLL